MAVLKDNSTSQESSHWYTRDGKALHRMPTADGKATRPTHLGDARKLNLFPSVTGILGVLAKPGLASWKEDQIVLATLRISRKKTETDGDYIDRVKEEAFKQVKDAQDKGTMIHKEIERFFTHDWSTQFEPNPLVGLMVGPVVNWMISNKIRVENPEKIVVNLKHGFAGTMDIPFRWKDNKGIGVIDFKSRKTKEGEPCLPYDEQPTQIASYAATYWSEEYLQYCWGANVYISTTEEGRVDLAMYKPAMLVAEYEMFGHLCAIWRHKNQYDPRLLPHEPQPVYHDPIIKQISGPGGKAVVESAPSGGKATPPPVSGAHDTDATQVLDQRLLKALTMPMRNPETDGIKFLDLPICHDMEMKGPGRIKTDYAWWFKTELGQAFVGLKNDAALLEQGWQQVCPAFAADINMENRAAGKPDPKVGTNGLPVPPPPPTAAKVAPAAKKISAAARLVQLEEYVLEFGAQKGKPLGKVANTYLDWLRDQKSILAKYPLIKEYVERPDVIAAIDRAMKRKTR